MSKKPKNRFEQYVQFIKDKLEDIDNPFKEASFAVGTGVERAFKQMVKRDEERAKEIFPDLYRDWKKKQEFNRGGTVMKDQMQMAFMQEGGLKDDGMDVDPVSGNDVPPGSMASEVRDDIPAQLSEGEYVVPADVVQYFGVKFFEDLRMDAKRGLADMESNGRIGGEPMDMPMDGMNQGGMMQGNEQTMPVDTGVGYNVGGATSNPYNNPTKMDQQVSNVMADNPQNMDMQNRTQAMMSPEQMDQANPPPPPRGFNPGGSVVPMPTVPNIDADSAAAYNYITSPTTINPIFATPGATYMAPPDPATMTGGGADSSIPSVENCDKMGMDFDPETNMCVPRAAVQTPQQGGGGSDNDDPFANMPKPDPDAWMEKYDYSGTDEGLGNLFDQTKAAIAGGSKLPGLIGTFDKGVTMAHSAANIILLDAQGKTGEAQQLLEQWQAARTGALKLTPLEMIDGDRFAIQAAGEHGILLGREATSIIDDKPLFKNDRDYEKYRVKYDAAVKAKQEQVVKETVAEPVKTSKDITSDAQIKQMKKDREESTKNINFGQTATKNLAGKDTATKQKITKSATKDLTSKEKKGGAALDTRLGITGLNKGGLMSKKKKKK